jgi:hypothetical protein
LMFALDSSRRMLFIPVLVCLVILTGLSCPASAAADILVSANGLWRDVNESEIGLQGQRWVVPDRYRTLEFDRDALNARLALAPLEYSPAAQEDLPVLILPLPDGGYGRFRFVASSVMAPDLVAQFPQIKTYAAVGIDDPTAYARFDLTPHGFHAMILPTGGTIYIDPYQRGDNVHAISYSSRDFRRGELFQEYGPLNPSIARQAPGSGLVNWSSGSELRTYRTAIAATGEYTQYFGGSVPDALAEIATLVNRVSGIYEREVAVRMQLIANETAIIYTDPTKDPYSNNNGIAMLSENQANLDAVIGGGNYDFGHVVSTWYGGGIAYL